MARSSPFSALIVVPTYNHVATLRRVVTGALAHGPVLVVDDGSTDLAPSRLAFAGRNIAPPGAFDERHPLHGLPIRYVRHERNQGKGAAILTGAAVARLMEASHIVTVDADGPHYTEDIPLFLEASAARPLDIFVGRRDFVAARAPGSSRFGRAFSNFWFKVQTGREIGDSQSGFRAYPLVVLESLALTERHYSFEVEVLVRAAWAGFELGDVPVRVYYPSARERVSHFRPFLDNLRLSVLNTRLTFRAIMPVPPKRFVQDKEGKITVLHPLRSIRLLLCRKETPKKLALSGALGVFIGTLPIFGLHSITILLLLGSLKLNKITGLATSQLCMPPFVPAMCIEAGYYLRQGRLLTEISWQTLGHEGFERILEWILGSLILAPLLAALCGGLIFALALAVRRGLALEGSS
jgi:glycosyltransferase involved in cell wall biosynthesis